MIPCEDEEYFQCKYPNINVMPDGVCAILLWLSFTFTFIFTHMRLNHSFRIKNEFSFIFYSHIHKFGVQV